MNRPLNRAIGVALLGSLGVSALWTNLISAFLSVCGVSFGWRDFFLVFALVVAISHELDSLITFAKDEAAKRQLCDGAVASVSRGSHVMQCQFCGRVDEGLMPGHSRIG